MNPLTQVKRTQFKDSTYVLAGGIPFDLTEGDLLTIFAYDEVFDVNLVRDKGTEKSKGFTFIAYEDQRSTILATENLNVANVLGRIIRVDHVSKYKKEKDEEEQQKKREARGVCYAFQKGHERLLSVLSFHVMSFRGLHISIFYRNTNTGWGSKEDSSARWEHDKHSDVPKSRGMCYAFQKGECNRRASCKFSHDDQGNPNTRRSSRGGESSRSERYGDREYMSSHDDRRAEDQDIYRHDKSPDRLELKGRGTMTNLTKEEKKDQKDTNMMWNMMVARGQGIFF
ncbi:hypothetical protein BS78_01G025700 [Paspalum vaginatum]|nr:hypothetical protein BS78_01G025700 [Paspalum vaginatum]